VPLNPRGNYGTQKSSGLNDWLRAALAHWQILERGSEMSAVPYERTRAQRPHQGLQGATSRHGRDARARLGIV
jgi:hypothetical protein